MNKKRYFHFSDLEENMHGMWNIVTGEQRKRNMTAAARLMKDPERFKKHMRSAANQWKNSAEFNLTSKNVNRIAWLGHAGCCVGAGSPEENTRCAWHTLTPKEQAVANQAANEVLQEWLCRNSDFLELEWEVTC